MPVSLPPGQIQDLNIVQYIFGSSNRSVRGVQLHAIGEWAAHAKALTHRGFCYLPLNFGWCHAQHPNILCSLWLYPFADT
jgi:hypothetical protein